MVNRSGETKEAILGVSSIQSLANQGFVFPWLCTDSSWEAKSEKMQTFLASLPQGDPALLWSFDESFRASGSYKFLPTLGPSTVSVLFNYIYLLLIKLQLIWQRYCSGHNTGRTTQFFCDLVPVLSIVSYHTCLSPCYTDVSLCTVGVCPSRPPSIPVYQQGQQHQGPW